MRNFTPEQRAEHDAGGLHPRWRGNLVLVGIPQPGAGLSRWRGEHRLADWRDTEANGFYPLASISLLPAGFISTFRQHSITI
ncbi:hypothetical protein KCP73_17785 [Salmonella enterica subsp. enterica]|nr:hypothetical protein KCP73_17785 [Salmonella enterica subsp. enterica]